MFFHSDTPTFDEWLALIQQDAARAGRLLIAIKARNKQLGLLADPALQMSIEDYQRAQALLARAAQDLAQARQVALAVRIGEALQRPAPDHAVWLALMADDPAFAHALYGALHARLAEFGPHAPQAILDSIAAYDAIRARGRE